jgi:hypothetical protein
MERLPTGAPRELLFQLRFERRHRPVHGWIADQWIDQEAEQKGNQWIKRDCHRARDKDPAVLLIEGENMKDLAKIGVDGDKSNRRSSSS